MQTVLFVTAGASFLAMFVLAGVRERLSRFSKWKGPLEMLAWLCSALWLGSIVACLWSLWLGSVVLLLVFFACRHVGRKESAP